MSVYLFKSNAIRKCLYIKYRCAFEIFYFFILNCLIAKLKFPSESGCIITVADYELHSHMCMDMKLTLC